MTRKHIISCDFLWFVEEFHWIRSSYVCIFVYASDLKTGFSFVAQAIPFKDERHITDACFLTLFQKKSEKDEKMQWACLSLIWSGGLIGTRSYYCDGWSEKRINKLLNSYFIMPYKLYWSPFFISFNSCLIFVNQGCYTTILSDNVWRWFVKLFFPFIFSVS